MRVVKSFFIALSLYSKIPVPQFAWKEEDMQYALCFFPWVGAVIGLCMVAWHWCCGMLQLGDICYVAVSTAIPILISGGFHVDGFMDTMDALHSYQSRERKLEILKDSHIGAFSVICLVLYYLLYAGALSEVDCRESIWILGAGFVLARALSGLSVVTFQSAKKEGMLYQFADSANRKIVMASLIIQIILCGAFMLYQSLWQGILVCAAAGITFLYYRLRSYKEFGGITGDTAGYFVTICEGVMVIVTALCCALARVM